MFIVSLIEDVPAVVFSVLLDGQLWVFEMSVAGPHAGALLHVVLAVAPGSPGFAAVVAGVWFELDVDRAEVVHHVAELRHALWAVIAEVELLSLACLLVVDGLSRVMLRELFLAEVSSDTI